MVYGELYVVLFFLSFFGGLAIKVILVKEILEMLNMFYAIYRILRDTNFVYLLLL